jgi:acyl carrier protein
MNEHIETVRSFIIDNFLFGNADGFSDDASFIDEGIIDSTGILELVGYLEQTYSIHVDDQELIPENLDSVVNIGQFLQRKLSNPN